MRAGAWAQSPWGDLKVQVFLGHDAFGERMRSQLRDANLADVPHLQRRPAPPALAHDMEDPECRRGMARAYRSGGYSMKAIGAYFGVHYATVSRALRRYESERFGEEAGTLLQDLSPPCALVRPPLIRGGVRTGV